MHQRVPKPFTLFLFFFLLSNYLSAAPEYAIDTARFSSPDGTTPYTPVTAAGTTSTFWNEDFTLSNGTTSDAGTTSWSVVRNPSTMLFSVLNNEFRINNCSTNGEGIWTSGTIDIT